MYFDTVSQKGFNPKPKKYLEHMGTITLVSTCLSFLPSPAWVCSACLDGTLLIEHLAVTHVDLRPSLRNTAQSDQVGGDRMEWRRGFETFISLCFPAGLWV